MGLRLKNAAMMYAKCGINILMMDYRGFGSSSKTEDNRIFILRCFLLSIDLIDALDIMLILSTHSDFFKIQYNIE